MYLFFNRSSKDFWPTLQEYVMEASQTYYKKVTPSRAEPFIDPFRAEPFIDPFRAEPFINP